MTRLGTSFLGDLSSTTTSHVTGVAHNVLVQLQIFDNLDFLNWDERPAEWNFFGLLGCFSTQICIFSATIQSGQCGFEEAGSRRL